MTTQKDQRICAQCKKVFEVKVRSYKRYCPDCFVSQAREAGKRGGRPPVEPKVSS